jgi:hypothetical protein
MVLRWCSRTRSLQGGEKENFQTLLISESERERKRNRERERERERGGGGGGGGVRRGIDWRRRY